MELFTFFKNYDGYTSPTEDDMSSVDRTGFINFVYQTNFVAKKIYFIGGNVGYKGLTNGLAYAISKDKKYYGPGVSAAAMPAVYRGLGGPPPRTLTVSIDRLGLTSETEISGSSKTWGDVKRVLKDMMNVEWDKAPSFVHGLFSTQQNFEENQKYFYKLASFALRRPLTAEEAKENALAVKMAGMLGDSVPLRAKGTITSYIKKEHEYPKDNEDLPGGDLSIEIELVDLPDQRAIYMKWVLYMVSKGAYVQRHPNCYLKNLAKLSKEELRHAFQLDDDGMHRLVETVRLLNAKSIITMDEAKQYLRCMGFSNAELQHIPSRVSLANDLFSMYSTDGETMPRYDKILNHYVNDSKADAMERLFLAIDSMLPQAAEAGGGALRPAGRPTKRAKTTLRLRAKTTLGLRAKTTLGLRAKTTLGLRF
jgi:hypothetical protein